MRFIYPFIVYFLLACSAFAQQTIKPAEINKILITSAAWGMGGGGGSDFEVLHEHGKWNIYYVRQFGEQLREPSYNQSFHIPIGAMSPLLLANFLNSVAVIKPQLNWRMFGLTPASFKTAPSKKSSPKTPKIEDFINDKTLEEAIKASGDNGIMDFMPTATIKIVKSNNDTLKIESHEQSLCMVPWTIGKTKTFDINISCFVSAVINNCDYANYDRLRPDELKHNVLNYIEDNYASAAIGNYNWSYGYPYNLKLIKSNFNISELRYTGNERRCKLSSKDWPANISIYATISIDDLAGIQHLIRFKDTISRCLKNNNFAFKYYESLPGGQIIFPFNPSLNSVAYIVLNDVAKRLPVIMKTDPGKWVNFEIKSPEGNSQWLLLPDNKLVLLWHSGKTVAAMNKRLLKQQDNSTEDHYTGNYTLLLLNADGTEK
jgi:hypothetical protein